MISLFLFYILIILGIMITTGNLQITFLRGEVIPNRSYPKPTAKQMSEHKRRIDAGPTKILYHQTSKEAANNILATQEMLRGSSGLAGGGIYFAATPEHTDHKALQKGKILECEVALGRTHKTDCYGDSSLSFRKLLSLNKGYDSVLIPRENGVEYVVYNKHQVKKIREYNQSKKSSWFRW